MKNTNTLRNIILASVFFVATSASAVSNAAQESHEASLKLNHSSAATQANKLEEMKIVYSQQELFDTEAYKAYVGELILSSAKQLIRDIAANPNYLAVK